MTAIIATYRHMKAADVCECIIAVAFLSSPVWLTALGIIGN